MDLARDRRTTAGTRCNLEQMLLQQSFQCGTCTPGEGGKHLIAHSLPNMDWHSVRHT
jgi:hypothetical protein